MAEFAPEVLFQIGAFPVTNTIINTLLIDAVLLGGAFYLRPRIQKIPGFFQNSIELIVSTFYDLIEQVSTPKNALKILPWVMTFFLFILLSNWSGLLPGQGSIGLKPKEHEAVHEQTMTKDHTPAEAGKKENHLIPLNRNATSDLNATLALALISLLATHALGIRATGIKDYLQRFFSFNPILLFVGILEIVSEFTKIVSLSFRLFGNIFAGEVVLTTISGLSAFIAPIPFMLLEVIVGLVQALVFAMLTMAFMSVLMTPHHSESH